MAIAIAAKNIETIIIPCYKVLSTDIVLGGPKLSQVLEGFQDVSPRRLKTVAGASSWFQTARHDCDTQRILDKAQRRATLSAARHAQAQTRYKGRVQSAIYKEAGTKIIQSSCHVVCMFGLNKLRGC